MGSQVRARERVPSRGDSARVHVKLPLAGPSRSCDLRSQGFQGEQPFFGLGPGYERSRHKSPCPRDMVSDPRSQARQTPVCKFRGGSGAAGKDAGRSHPADGRTKLPELVSSAPPWSAKGTGRMQHDSRTTADVRPAGHPANRRTKPLTFHRP